ncbi:hypothetical protein CONPUDRAFT_90628 [Coniophora puteana RWD-64-598 SS2]|uniref:Uncharacterized protein n=1 Tax=Coniophora puteana (strain RWD-64-598) TaxID=741705 RepID=A0A5M3MP27_CONPW|nr:uncharacterized protein CONPUDRAFT_90628 [Coniophora puteana RWD-64-598 SS2]EIW80391.1 hypothetical protein CONPUDRAFT_90628 [Coniophora puteana RWD-64-598 SS2]
MASSLIKHSSLATLLPTELLSAIFVECASLPDHDFDPLSHYAPMDFHTCSRECLSWLIVTHLCRRWRLIARSTPSLWTVVPLFDLKWTREMISCAGALPLTIQADMSLLLQPFDGLREVLNHIGRIRDFRLSDGGLRDEAIKLFEGIHPDTGGPHGLERLCLRSDDNTGSQDSRLPSNIFHPTVPSLKRLRLDNWALDFLVASPALQNLTHLQLISIDYVDYDIMDFMTALAAMGHLQALTLIHSFYPHDEVPSYDIALPSLTCVDMENDHLVDCNALFANFRLSRPLDQFRLHFSQFGSFEQEISVLRSMIQQSKTLEEGSDGRLSSVDHYLTGLSFGHFSLTQGSVRFELSVRAPSGRRSPVQFTGRSWQPPAFSLGCGCFVEQAESFLSNMLGIVSLQSVCFATFFGYDTPQPCWDVLCRELPSVRVLLVLGCSVESMARALMPVPGQDLPAPSLRRMLLFDVRVDTYRREGVPSLRELADARQARGSPLEVLEMNPHAAMGERARDWAAFQSQGLDIVWDVVRGSLGQGCNI